MVNHKSFSGNETSASKKGRRLGRMARASGSFSVTISETGANPPLAGPSCAPRGALRTVRSSVWRFDMKVEQQVQVGYNEKR